MENRQRLQNGILAIITLIYTIAFFYVTGEACALDDLSRLASVNSVTSIMFCFLGVVFFAVGVIMNISLSNHFPEFYSKYRCLLWTATLLLTIPLFIRTVKDYLYYHNDEFANWYENNLAYTNTLFAILSTVLPIIT